VKTHRFEERVRQRALELAASSDRPPDARGVVLTPLERTIDDDGYHYRFVDARIDRASRRATLTVSAPDQPPPDDLDAMLAAGARWWPLHMARELDDAILMLRTNELDIGTWLLKTRGNADHVLAADATLLQHANHWFVRETVGMIRRTFARLEVSSRTLFALIEPGSAFAGTLLELALAADRSYMLTIDTPERPTLAVSEVNFGAYPRVDDISRLAARFHGDQDALAAIHATLGSKLDAQHASRLGLVTAALDDIDWPDEIRLALEERQSLSPDALTGMEANLRFGMRETMKTRIFGRLSAWQNWIFVRPNAVGDAGALKVFGTGNKARFDWKRV